MKKLLNFILKNTYKRESEIIMIFENNFFQNQI